MINGVNTTSSVKKNTIKISNYLKLVNSTLKSFNKNQLVGGAGVPVSQQAQVNSGGH